MMQLQVTLLGFTYVLSVISDTLNCILCSALGPLLVLISLPIMEGFPIDKKTPSVSREIGCGHRD